MNKFIFYILLLLFISKTTAQCLVEESKVVYFCYLDFSDTIYLNPIFFNIDTPIQSVVWDYSYEIPNSTTGITERASDFLNDTSILNPYFRFIPLLNDFYIHLSIVDNIGNSCSDSLRIIYSNFNITMVDYDLYRSAGDTTGIYASVAGGIPPITYSWFPKENIDTISNGSCCPFVWPEQDVTYFAIATDSMGCSVGVNPSWRFFITPSSISNLNETQINAYPNPTSDILFFDFENENKFYEIELFDLSGKCVLKQNIFNNQLNLSEFQQGVYYYYIYNKSEIIAHGKVLKE